MAQQKLNTGTSIVDYLKSTNQDSSFGNRGKLAVDLGLVKTANQYTGSAQQNTSLLQRLQTQPPKSVSSVTDQSQAMDFINADQSNDIAAVKAAEEVVPVRGEIATPPPSVSNSLVDAFKTLTGKDSITPTSQLPTAPNFLQSFQAFREQYGVGDLESKINEFDAQQQDLEAQLRINVDAERGKPVAQNVIEGRVSQQTRNIQEQYDFLGRQKQRLVNELTAANNTIETMMSFQKMDYDVASQQYDREFSQNLQMFNTIKGAVEFDISEQERAQDYARSNLQIIYNSIGSGNVRTDEFDDATKAKVMSMELKAGLPQGFYEKLAIEKPNSKILSTTTRTSGGVKYADVLMQNTDGSISVENVQLGRSSSASGSGSSTSKSYWTQPDPNTGDIKYYYGKKGDINSSQELSSDQYYKGQSVSKGALIEEEEKQFLSKDYFKGIFTQEQLESAAANSGFGDLGEGLFNLKDVDTDRYLDYLDGLITQYRNAGYSDKEILSMMQ